MKSILKNEQGLAGILMTLLVAIVIGMLIYAVKARMSDLTRDFGHQKAFFDAEVAVEKFAILLKGAYDRGSNYTDLQNSVAGFVCNPGPTLANGINLCWPTSDTKICVDRTPNPTNASPICIENNSDYIFSLNTTSPLELEVNVASRSQTEVATLDLAVAAVRELVGEFGLNHAKAALDASRPAMPSVIPTNQIELVNAVPTGTDCDWGTETASCKNYRAAPKNYACEPVDDTNPVACLKIKFCVKFSGTCISAGGTDEYIRQTFMFLKAPKNALGY